MREIKRRMATTSMWVIGLAGFLLAASAFAGPAESPPPPLEEASPSGLRAYIDPETGELTSTPSAAQVELLSQALEASPMRSSWRSDDLEPFELRLGGRGIFLDGRFQSALVARWSDSGALEFQCLEEQHEHIPDQPSRSETEWVEK